MGEATNMAVIEVTFNAAQALAERFGFEVDDEQMLALQAAIYDIFGKQIAAGEIR